MLSKLLARQLSKPKGPAGLIAGRMMNRLNGIMTAHSIELLGIQPGDHVLEIGFGGGYSLDLLLNKTAAGRVVGLENSSAMLTRARRHHRLSIEHDQLRLAFGQVEQMHFFAETFDCVCSINTLYFWSDLSLSVREIQRVLKPGGTLVLSFRPDRQLAQLKFTRHEFTLYPPEAIVEVLENNGFKILATEQRNDGHLDYSCVVAKK